MTICRQLSRKSGWAYVRVRQAIEDPRIRRDIAAVGGLYDVDDEFAVPGGEAQPSLRGCHQIRDSAKLTWYDEPPGDRRGHAGSSGQVDNGVVETGVATRAAVIAVTG